MKDNEDLEYNVVPGDGGNRRRSGKTDPEKAERNKVFKENVLSSLLGYGIGVANTILKNTAEQGASFAGKVLDNKDDNSNDDKSFSERLKEEFVRHGWGLIYKLDDDLGDIKKEFTADMRDNLAGRFGSGLADLAFSANDIKDDLMALKVASSMRQTMQNYDEIRDAGLEFPESVQAFTDIRYGDDRTWNVLDIYRPADMAGKGKHPKKLPVIVNFHGGAWIYGDKENYKYYCASLAERGFAVVNYSFRLPPEYKYPCYMTDTNDVFRWMCRNYREYGLDMDNIFAMADSAGANIAGMYICILTNDEYAENYDFVPPAGVKINAAAFNCGAVDPLNFMGEKELMKGLVVDDDNVIRKGILNVTDFMTADFPPVYLMSCVGDFCRKYVKHTSDVLERLGIDHMVKIYGTEEEPLGHVFHLSVRSELGAECSDRECSFFRNYIKHSKHEAQ